MNEIIDILKKWETEANSGYNDGWTQKHYKDKINEVARYLDNNGEKVFSGYAKERGQSSFEV